MFKVLGHEEFVIGTRYGSGELKVDKDWPLYRQVNGSSISSSCVRTDCQFNAMQIISKGARELARPLTALSDPMTGTLIIQSDIIFLMHA